MRAGDWVGLGWSWTLSNNTACEIWILSRGGHTHKATPHQHGGEGGLPMSLRGLTTFHVGSDLKNMETSLRAVSGDTHG